MNPYAEGLLLGGAVGVLFTVFIMTAMVNAGIERAKVSAFKAGCDAAVESAAMVAAGLGHVEVAKTIKSLVNWEKLRGVTT